MGKVKKTNKSPDKRPARANYWARKRLQERKVKNLMRRNKMTRAEALAFWLKARTKRVKRLGTVQPMREAA